MKPLAAEFRNQIINGDCLEVLRSMPDACVDSVVTDPPYGLGNREPTGEDIHNYLNGKSLDTGGDFMGKEWEIPPVAVWQECYRILKPGGHLLAFAGTRTWDIMSIGIRAANFENRDTVASMFGPSVLQWVHGQGFPKSLNIGKAIEKLKGVNKDKEREIAAYLKERREALDLSKSDVDEQVFGGTTRYAFVEGRDNEDGNFRIYLPTPEEWTKLKTILKLDGRYDKYVQEAIPTREMRSRIDGGKGELVGEEDGSFGYQQDGERWEGSRRIVQPSSEDAKKWAGWGTALKPAWEPVLCFRKPVEESTIAGQVVETGTGGLNIDGTRVKHANAADLEAHKAMVAALKAKGGKLGNSWKNSSDLSGANEVKEGGRWPANVVMVHSPKCKKTGTKKVPAPVINRFDDGMKPFGGGAGHVYTSQQTGDADGNEEVDVFECIDSCPVKLLDDQSGVTTSGAMKREVPGYEGTSATPFLRGRSGPSNQHGGSGGASRYFGQFTPDAPFYYSAKASRSERNSAFETKKQTKTKDKEKIVLYKVKDGTDSDVVLLIQEMLSEFIGEFDPETERFEKTWFDVYVPATLQEHFEPDESAGGNDHPTVKPIALMKFLVKLVTPKGGVVLDPYCGSGTTCQAATEEGMDFIGIEKDPHFFDIAEKRVMSKHGKAEDLRNQDSLVELADELADL